MLSFMTPRWRVCHCPGRGASRVSAPFMTSQIAPTFWKVEGASWTSVGHTCQKTLVLYPKYWRSYGCLWLHILYVPTQINHEDKLTFVFNSLKFITAPFARKVAFKLLISWPAMKIKTPEESVHLHGEFLQYLFPIMTTVSTVHIELCTIRFFFLSKEPFQHKEKDTHLQ